MECLADVSSLVCQAVLYIQVLLNLEIYCCLGSTLVSFFSNSNSLDFQISQILNFPIPRFLFLYATTRLGCDCHLSVWFANARSALTNFSVAEGNKNDEGWISTAVDATPLQPRKKRGVGMTQRMTLLV